ADADTNVTVVAPVNQPRQGYVVYYDTRRAAARRRLDKTLSLLHEAGVRADGVVVESDAVSALRDAVEQMQRVSGDIPFSHVVVYLNEERGDRNVLVVANQTVLGAPLLDKIRQRAK